MGNCSIKLSDAEEKDLRKSDFNSAKVTTLQEPRDPMKDFWLTRNFTPVSDRANNMNRKDPLFEFSSQYDPNRQKPKAYLVSVNQTENKLPIKKILWTKQWGYIVFDSDLNPTIHGNSVSSMGIGLSKIEGTMKCIKVGESNAGPALMIKSDFGNEFYCFPEYMIDSTVKANQKFLRSDEKWFECYFLNFKFKTFQQKIVHSERTINLNDSFDFYCLSKDNTMYLPKYATTLKKTLDIHDEEESHGTNVNMEEPCGPNVDVPVNETGKLLNSYKECQLSDTYCICIIQKIDHWEIMCGHDSGKYSLWRIELADLHVCTDFCKYPQTADFSKINNETEEYWVSRCEFK